MLAAVLKDFNNLVLEDVPIPEPKAGEFLVRIKSCGICATDYKAVRGIRRNVTFPLVPGHEPSGIIARVGPGVKHFKEDDEVICQPSGCCGVCEQCRNGNTHYCEYTFTPGWVATPKQLMLNMHAAEKRMLKREQALPYILHPEHEMGSILFLLSKVSRSVTGQNLLGECGKVMT